MQVVFSNPYAELAIKNEKYIKNCSELYLAKRGITTLRNFDRFINLEILWINNNCIQKLDSLDACFRIKELYAQKNALKTLQGSSLLKFTFLTCLRVSDNDLEDLHATLSVLSKCAHLQELDLYNNPLAEENNYRLHVISTIPSLQVLDRHVITQDERSMAHRVIVLGEEVISKAAVAVGAPPTTISQTVKMLMKEVAAAERAACQQTKQFENRVDSDLDTPESNPPNRIGQNKSGLNHWQLSYLRKMFAQYDKQRKGYVTPEQFQEIVQDGMRKYGSYLLLVPENEEQRGPQEQQDEAFLAAQEAFINKDTSLMHWKAFVEACEGGLPLNDDHPQHFLWQVIPHHELMERALEMYEASETIQQKAMSLPAADSRDGAMIEQAHELSQTACRLEALSLSYQENVTAENRRRIAAMNVIPPRTDTLDVATYHRIIPPENQDETVLLSGTKSKKIKMVKKKQDRYRVEKTTFSLRQEH